LKKHPETVKVLRSYHLDCIGCMGAEQESLRNVSWQHGVELTSLLKDLNKAITK
ncbi:MAG: disulfide oxidoreductase, partial [Proteobacteria bacterium]|nr:disulfide oxidoreductase [Pseudomonadota bacterium]